MRNKYDISNIICNEMGCKEKWEDCKGCEDYDDEFLESSCDICGIVVEEDLIYKNGNLICTECHETQKIV